MDKIWDTAKAYWADPSPENRAKLPDWLNFEGVRNVYLDGVPERLKPLFPPECWHFDWERMRQSRQDRATAEGCDAFASIVPAKPARA